MGLAAYFVLGLAWGADAPALAAAGAGDLDALADLAQWLYRAAMRGEWRLFFGALLVGVVGFTKWASVKFKPELEEAPWWKAYVLPWLPVFWAVAAAVGVDLMHGKPVWTSVWRGVGIGATAAWAYKAVWAPMLQPLLRAVLARLFPQRAASG